MPAEDGANNLHLIRESRIPRAPNLKFIRLLLKKMSDHEILELNEYRSIAANVLGSRQPQYTNEYLKMLITLGFVKKINKFIYVSEITRNIAEKFTEEKELTIMEKEIFQERLFENNSVRWFLETIFGYDIKEHKWNKPSQPLTSGNIAQKYLILTGLSKATGRREARLLTNWLGQIGLLEQSFTGKYYLTVGLLNYEFFERIIEQKYHEFEVKERSGTKWVEIAQIEASICEESNISKEIFDDFFKRLVDEKRGLISISPGSAGLKEVKRFGVEINNRLIYYIRFNR